MTKTERTAMQNFMNKYEEIRKEQDRIFNELQIENKSVNGNAWCCAETNAEELYKAGFKWAKGSYQRYVELRGQMDLLMQYGNMLAELNFWKETI